MAASKGLSRLQRCDIRGCERRPRTPQLQRPLPQEAASQSRLTQWKLPASLDQEDKPPQQNGAPGGGDFSRAPGPSKGALHPLLGPPDGPWAQGGGGGAPRGQDGWPESSRPSNSPPEAKEASSAYSLGDLVAEFEPGKPWKGASSMKSAEDDPHLTPGSVVRSPLSLNTIKDSELFGGGWKQSPPATEGSLAASLASLTSSTWAFTPAMHTYVDPFGLRRVWMRCGAGFDEENDARQTDGRVVGVFASNHSRVRSCWARPGGKRLQFF